MGQKFSYVKRVIALANKRLKTTRDKGRLTHNISKLMHTYQQLNVKVSLGLEVAESELVFGINMSKLITARRHCLMLEHKDSG